MNHSIKIECPVCKRETELLSLKSLGADENTIKEFNELKNTGKLVTPEMSKLLYDSLCRDLSNNLSSSVGVSICKIKSHNVKLFGEACAMSNKVFRVLFVYVIDHNVKSAGVTFHIGEEVKDE